MKAGPRWKCRDGRELAISEMETAHIRNAIAMIQRAGYVSVFEHVEAMPSPAAGFDPESMAAYYADQQFDTEVEQWEAQKRTLWLDLFRAELRRRGEPV